MLESQELSCRHREIIRLKSIGMTTESIGEELGVSRQLVAAVSGSALGKEHLERLNADRDMAFMAAKQELEMLLPAALDAYREVLEKQVVTTPMQRVKVASEIMDRTGFGKVTKTISYNPDGQLTPDDIEMIKKEALARARATDVIPREVGEDEE